MPPVISVENLSKSYRLGQIGTGTFTHDLAAWWAKMRGRPDPMLKIGQADHGNRDGEELMALRDVSFTVQQGEVLGIIGKNGAGKSTLLKILSRVTAPTSGVIKVKGRIASLLEVGTGFHPELTGRENIYLNGAILGMSRQEVTRKFDEIVDFAGVEKFIDTPVKRYSSGMYVRLAFAVAAHLEPEILVVDEVLAVGDASFQKKCIGKMGEVAKGGRTVLFVSHQMASVQSLCSNAILLERGQTSHIGLVEKTIQIYLESLENNIAEIPLSTRERRAGGNEFRFTKYVVLDAKSRRQINSITSGQDILISLSYTNRSKRTINNLVTAITFHTLTNTFLFSCRSDSVGKDFNVSSQEGTLICHIPKFPLNLGRYLVNVLAYEKNTIIDWVENAGIIDVEAGDFYGTGKLPASSRQGVFVEFNWDTSEI